MESKAIGNRLNTCSNVCMALISFVTFIVVVINLDEKNPNKIFALYALACGTLFLLQALILKGVAYLVINAACLDGRPPKSKKVTKPEKNEGASEAGQE